MWIIHLIQYVAADKQQRKSSKLPLPVWACQVKENWFHVHVKFDILQFQKLFLYPFTSPWVLARLNRDKFSPTDAAVHFISTSNNL